MLSRTVRRTALDTEFSLPKDWSFKDIPQGTPLHIAAEIEYLDAVVLLLKAGANIDAVNEDLETALYSAVVAKKPAIVQLLLKNGANVNVRDWKGCSIVHAACTGGGDIKILRLLHSVGADFSCRDGQGSTPLHVACKESTPGVVHYLLSLGLDSIAADYHGTIPQDLLVQYGLQHSLAFVLNFISEHQPFLSTLAMAWSDTDTLMLRKMGMRLPQDSLTLYANAHFCEAGGTPLYLAALSGHVQVCDILRRFGALVNLEGGQEGTPLMAACYQGRLNAAQYLIRAGAEISYWKRGRLVSALEAAKRFPEIVRWILVGRYTEQKILTFGKSEIPDGTRSKPSWNTVHSLDVVFLEEWDTYSRSQVMQQTSRTFTCSNDGCCEMMELATA
jgi:ankyrin repeat protein